MPEKAYYVTKYALTRGILKVNGVLYHENLKAKVPGYANDIQYFRKKYVESTPERARKAAAVIRDAKIARLKRQIQLLEKKTFYEIEDLTNAV